MSLLCVALGAITTICVAWVAVLLSSIKVAPPPEFGSDPLPAYFRGYTITASGRGNTPACRATFWLAAGEATSNAAVEADGVPSSVLVIVTATRKDAGWPLMALRTDRIDELTAHDSAPKLTLMQSGIALPALLTPKTNSPLDPKALPLMPLWPGFAIDTALYASVAWLIIAAPRTLRRVHRHNGGRCPACGYHLAGLDRCPECGAHS